MCMIGNEALIYGFALIMVLKDLYAAKLQWYMKLTRFLILSGSVSSLSGVAKLWKMPNVEKISTLKGHTERATDVAFSPVHDHLATASADRTARLWDTRGSLLRTFEGYLDRLARISFHPSGKYLGTTSFDKTWRLWDVENGEELLLQEGHSRSVYGLDFHRDGSLAASCGLDALARVWDLRTGRSILALEGHVKPVRLKTHLLFFFLFWCWGNKVMFISLYIIYMYMCMCAFWLYV